MSKGGTSEMYMQPQALELEGVVLGAILFDNRAINSVITILSREVFYVESHKLIWDAIEGLFRKGNPIDMLTVSEAMKTAGTLNDVGGRAYIAVLTNTVASAANIEYHARILWEKSMGRALLNHCQKVIQEIAHDGGDIPDVLARHQDAIYKLGQVGAGAQTMARISDDMLDKARMIHERGGEMVGLPLTGLEPLDKLLGGWEPGDVIIFGGRPKSGKSSIASNIIKHHIKSDLPLYAASGEMQNLKVGFRVAAALADLPTRYLEQGKFFDKSSDVYAFEQAHKELQASKVWLEDTELSVPKMLSVVHYYFYNHGVKLFLFDRIGLFKEVLTSKDDYKARMEVTGAMRSLANKLGVAIVAFSQVNTDAEKSASKRPESRHLFGGIGAQSNCTKAALVYRPEMYGIKAFPEGKYKDDDAKGMAEIYTVLNNYLELGSVKLVFDGNKQIFKQDLLEEDWNLSVPERESEDDLPF